MSRRAVLLAALGVPFQCTWGTPQWHPEPVLVPDRAYEGSCAMPFSDGCWWDDDRQCFCLWYMAGYNGGTALAQSTDGYVWRKLGLVDPTPRDSSTVWPDGGGYVRATFFMRDYPDPALTLQRSPDGITWRTVGRVPGGDRSTLYRLTDGRWVLSARESATAERGRAFYVADVFEGPYRRAGEFYAEPSDDPQALIGVRPQAYNLDAAPLGAGYLGLLAVWGGARADAPKRNTLRALTSRDGVSWNRGPALWIDEQPGAQNVQSCGGVYVMLKPDLLGIYVSTRSGPVAAQRCVTRLLTVPVREVCV